MGHGTQKQNDFRPWGRVISMSAEDLEQYESDLELQLYREYKDVVGIFTYAVETERRFYLCNAVDLKVRTEGGDVYYEVSMSDAWVWDMYRPARFVKSAKVLTFRDVSIEEIAHSDLEVPKPTSLHRLRTSLRPVGFPRCVGNQR